MAELNGAVMPRLAAVYDGAAPLLSKRGRQIVDRALKKGTVGGDVGMQLLFEPAMLLSLIADGDVLYELADVAQSIPFIGNYNQWLPASATICASYRVLSVEGDARATNVEAWLSLPGHGRPAEAMSNRLAGRLLEQIRSDAYTAPLKLPQFSYVIAKLRELSVMWAFGGSAAWPRTRIDEGIDAVQQQVSDFFA